MIRHSIVIIGAGPAGMAAAVAAYDAGVTDILMLEREKEVGGILRQCIHSGFGLHKLGEELTGPEYALRYAQMVQKRKIQVMTETTVISLNNEKVITAVNSNGLYKIKADAVILAMGCRERSRGALNIPGTRPAGVYSAGTAQKLINCEGYKIGTRAVILGSGDIGLIMARRLTLQGVKVEAVCEIMPYSGGLTRNIVQCLDDFNIPLYLSTTVAEIHGRERVEGVTIAQVDEKRNIIKETCKYIPCDTLLLSVGLIPENELTEEAGIKIDTITGGAVVDQNRQTSIEGVFACGNVLQVHDLVDYVSLEAEIAGAAAAKYLQSVAEKNHCLKTVAGDGVRYVLPHNITDERQEFSLFFRVIKPYKNVKLNVFADGRLIKSERRIRAVPAEMEKISIKPGELAENDSILTVSVEEL